MSIQTTGIKAYVEALADFAKAEKKFENHEATLQAPHAQLQENTFEDTLRASLGEVNEMQGIKSQMIQSFASGETQNVHELMITLQKAGLAINMTSAVRNKVLEAYRELTRLQF